MVFTAHNRLSTYKLYTLCSDLLSVLVIDNYDSFTFNLVHYLEGLNCEVSVIRNDEICDEKIAKFQKIILSPGPGLPDDAGQLKSFIDRYAPTKSIFGICLGQQAITEIFGGKLLPLPTVKHGITGKIRHLSNDYIYTGLPETFEAGLYYSWHSTNLSNELIPTAFSSDGIIMSLKHSSYDLRAVQFHPESIMTSCGKEILKNWLHQK